MKRAQIILSLSLLLCVASRNVNAQTIQNPLVNFLETTVHSSDDRVISFTVNFGADKECVFVSLPKLVDGRAGNIWQAYLKDSSGYEALDQPISFRRDVLALTTVDSLGGLALVSYAPNGAERGALVAFQLDSENKIVEHNLGQIEPLGKDSNLYSKFFSDEATKVAVVEQPVGDIRPASANHDTPTNESSQSIQPPSSANIHPTASSPRPEVIPTDSGKLDSEKDSMGHSWTFWIGLAFIAVVLGTVFWVVFARGRSKQ